MEKYFKQLLEANTVTEVTDLLENFEEEVNIKWIPVGGRQDNIATINIGTDPAAGLTERITNAIDAVIELEWHKQGKPEDISTPRQATENWFNIPEGRLRNVKREDIDSKLAKRVQIILRNSEKASNPTVEIRDTVIGIKAEDFSKTILSLHGGNKLNKCVTLSVRAFRSNFLFVPHKRIFTSIPNAQAA